MGCGSSKNAETSENKPEDQAQDDGKTPKQQSNDQGANAQAQEKQKIEGVNLGGGQGVLAAMGNSQLGDQDWNARLHGAPGAFYEKNFCENPKEKIEPHYGEPLVGMLFATYATGDDNTFTKTDFIKFLQEEQKEPAPQAIEYANTHYPRFATSTGTWDVQSLRRYVFSVANAAFNPLHQTVYQDMTRPLTDYLISTSHNTYLGGAQIWDESDPEFYSKTITSGARVVELDVQDGEGDDDGEPEIHHMGWTKSLSARECLLKIAEVAFKCSDYPLFLMFEQNIKNHQQQSKLAKAVQEIFGDRVPWGWEGRFMGNDFETREFLPSPEELKGKVLCCAGGGVNHPDLVGLMHFRVNNRPADQRRIWQYFNQDETDLTAIMLDDDQAQAFVKQNCKTLTRIYPKGLRVDSSNYDPLLAWNAGVQFAAMNMQTIDDLMWIHQGMFRQNGFCGYVLKPDIQLNKPANCPVTKVSVRVLCAKELREDGDKRGDGDDDLDPYCEIEIAGHPDDQFSWRSKVQSDSGSYVLWDEACDFTLRYPEHAMVKVLVSDRDVVSPDDLLGQAVIPFTSLRQGNRVLHLQNHVGFFKFGSKVLLNVDIQQE